MSEQTYPCTYTVEFHDPPLSAHEVRALNRGGCDAVVIHSLLYPEDGSFSCLTISARDGEEELEAGELWKLWTLVAHDLSQNEKLSDNKRELCKLVFDTVCQAVREASER